MDGLTVKQAALVTRPLWFHKRSLMQTSSGYGGNLKTEYMMYYNNRNMIKDYIYEVFDNLSLN